MKTCKYDIFIDHAFGMHTKVRLDLTAEEVAGIVKYMNECRSELGFAPIKLVALVLEGEDDEA